MARYRWLIHVRLDDDCYALVKALAEELNISMSEAVREIIRFAALLDPLKVKKYLPKIRMEYDFYNPSLSRRS